MVCVLNNTISLLFPAVLQLGQVFIEFGKMFMLFGVIFAIKKIDGINRYDTLILIASLAIAGASVVKILFYYLENSVIMAIILR